MKRPLHIRVIFCILFLVISSFYHGAHGQLPITASGDTASINFSGFAGLGFSPIPAPGELSSNTWSINGETDSLVFGGTRNTLGTIFARGVVGANQVSAGVYAYSRGTDTLMMLQPTAASFSPGTITLRVQNTTGSTLTSLYIGYHFFVRNDAGRANSFNLLHSADNAAYITIPALDYTSPDALVDTNIIDIGIRETTINGVSVPNGAYYYFRWYSSDVSGSGSRDEFFIDDIKLVGTAGPSPNSPPVIGSVVRSAFVPENTSPLTVSAIIMDDHNLTAQRLLYVVNGVIDSVAMTAAGADSFFAAIPADSNLNGNRVTYYVRAYDDSGAVSTSTSSSYLAGTTSVFMIRQNDGNGVNVFSGHAVRVTGISTAETGIFSTTARDFYVQDGTRGVNVFLNNTSLPAVARGDSIVVEGTIAQFNGKLEITTPGLTYSTISSGHDVGPMNVTVSQISESLEGTLVRIEGVTRTSGLWPTAGNNATLYISDNGGLDTTGLFIDRDTDIDGTSEPVYPATIVGIASQFDASIPFTGGYQIQPRDLNDIDENDAPSPSVLLVPVDETLVGVSDTSSGSLDFVWTRSDDPEDSQVTYIVWLDSSLSFGASAISFLPGNGGQDTTIAIVLGDLNAYVAGLGVAPGASIRLFWQVVSSDGMSDTPSASAFRLDVDRHLVNFAPGAFHLLSPSSGSRLVSSPASRDTTWFVWNPSIDPDGDPVIYRVEFDTSLAFGMDQWMEVSDTTFPGDHLGLDYFLSDLGVVPGDSILMYWRVRALTELHSTISLDTFNVRALRGLGGANFTTLLGGSSEIPPTSSTGFGLGNLAVNPDSTAVFYEVYVDFLSGPITTAHLYNGPVYGGGTVVKDITFEPVIFDGDTIFAASGFWTSTDPQPLTTSLVSELFANRLYVNVHTTAFSGGEVRGQVVPDTLLFDFSVADNLTSTTGDGLAHLDWELVGIALKGHQARRANKTSAWVQMVGRRRGVGFTDPAILGYTIYRSTDGTNYSLLQFTGDTTSVFVDSTVSVGATYHYFVGAVHEWGITSPSNVTSISPVLPVEDVETRVPLQFDLHANYPNPFNPATVIRYDLKETVPVVLKIYNLLGQEVRTLVSNRESAGYKTVAWDGRNNRGKEVATGIYLYRLQAGSFVKTRKMTLIK